RIKTEMIAGTCPETAKQTCLNKRDFAIALIHIRYPYEMYACGCMCGIAEIKVAAERAGYPGFRSTIVAKFGTDIFILETPVHQKRLRFNAHSKKCDGENNQGQVPMHFPPRYRRGVRSFPPLCSY